jgi:molybdate transport system ATP-binding protein
VTSLHVDAAIVRDDFTLDLELDVAAGQVVAVVGPNGAGKTTLLRAIAGLVPVTRGRLRLGEEVLDDAGTDTFVPVERRPVSVVFQDYRLFPHLTVIDNVAFALRSSGASRAGSRRAVRDLLSRLELDELAERRPSQLSGGQAQRVALARALAADPHVLLLDEPLSALDAQTRLEVRSGLRQHLAGFPGVCLLVTHDPLEALVLADHLVVLEDGRVTQQGPPAEVARRPASPYVASLVGLNLYAGRASDDGTVTLEVGGSLIAGSNAQPGPVLLTVRPSAVALYAERPQRAGPRNVWPGVIASIELLTDRVRIQVDGASTCLRRRDAGSGRRAEARTRVGRVVGGQVDRARRLSAAGASQPSFRMSAEHFTHASRSRGSNGPSSLNTIRPAPQSADRPNQWRTAA